MPRWLKRVILLGVLGCATWIAWVLLSRVGLAWLVYVGWGGVAALFVLELSLTGRKRARQSADHDRWERALLDPGARRPAIAELRAAVARAARLGRRGRLRRARLSMSLSELLTAEGRHEQAIRVLAKVPTDELEDAQAAVVRHGRAQAYLAAGDPEGAQITLKQRPESSGDPVLDRSLDLLELMAAAELGEGERALEALAALRGGLDDPELVADAEIVEACALLRLDRPEEARAKLAAVDQEVRARAAALGPPGLRELLAG